MQPRKLTQQQVTEIQELAKTTTKKVDIAKQFGVSPQLVSTVIRYGYETRPPIYRSIPAGSEPESWESLAKALNAKYPEEPVTAAQVRQIHDIALKKIAAAWAKQGISKEDLF
jgi:hypothetical protein